MTTRFNLVGVYVTSFILPYPPSINNYYGRTRTGQVYIKKPGVEFRKDVEHLLSGFGETLTKPLRVWVEVWPPDSRKRDLDNVKKALLDAMTHARVYEDDSIIMDLRTIREDKFKDGRVIVHIWTLDHEN